VRRTCQIRRGESRNARKKENIDGRRNFKTCEPKEEKVISMHAAKKEVSPKLSRRISGGKEEASEFLK